MGNAYIMIWRRHPIDVPGVENGYIGIRNLRDWNLAGFTSKIPKIRDVLIMNLNILKGVKRNGKRVGSIVSRFED